jgi:phage terminase large subunit-like protein
VTIAPAETELIGDQRPRLSCIPQSASSAAGQEATDLSRQAGLRLDDWQSWAVEQAMGTRTDGRWSAFEVGILVSRQNGKNAILQARQLAGLFLLGESLLIHTAHEFKAANEHFRRMRDLVESQSWLMSKVRPHGIRTSHGDEAIELRSTPTLIFGHKGTQIRRSVAPRLRFLARSRGSGRSFTCDCLFYDESMILTDEEVGASLPTLSAVANPQVWYTASAGYPDSTQLNRVRNRGINGSDNSLTWLEWSINEHHEMCLPGCREHDEPDSVHSWAKANPGLGIRISVEHVTREFVKMSPAEFRRERLGVGDWPADEFGWAVIPEAVWNACTWREPEVRVPADGALDSVRAMGGHPLT